VSANPEPLIAVFIDFENLALGTRDGSASGTAFDVGIVIQRMLEKGRIVYKRAYCDWNRFRGSTKGLHEHGVELVEIPQTRQSGKNSADIRMVVDAIDLCYAKQHIDIFALVTGDSDFSPLAAKLKENDKRVIGCGVRQSTSPLLINSCDEFIYYDDLAKKRETRPKKKPPTRSPTSDGTAQEPATSSEDGIAKVVEIVESLESDYDVLWGSMVKQALRRVDPGFSEKAQGYENFAALLEAADDQGVLEIDFDEERGNYAISLPSQRRRGRGRGKRD
jgi:hypothetical protein